MITEELTRTALISRNYKRNMSLNQEITTTPFTIRK